MFSDRWRLETVPTASVIFSRSPPPTTAASADPSLLPGGTTLPSNPISSGGGRGGDDHNAYSGNPATVTDANGSISTLHKSNQDEEREASGTGGRAVVVPGFDESAAVSVVSEGAAEVGLRGVAVAPDTRRHARKRLAEGVERGVLAAKVEEIVREVVRGVRTPVREEEVSTINNKARCT